MFSLKFILDVYADPEKADRDGSRVLSPAEAASLAVALSLDGLAVGFGAALMQVNVLIVMLFSLAVGMLAVRLGGKIGNRAAQKLSFDLSWFSGALLIVLAILKL
ncbi:MAG: manganese efflux pump [Acutalibacteraceae bacterium]|mgnify:FL=1